MKERRKMSEKERDRGRVFFKCFICWKCISYCILPNLISLIKRKKPPGITAVIQSSYLIRVIEQDLNNLEIINTSVLRVYQSEQSYVIRKKEFQITGRLFTAEKLLQTL